MGTDVGTHVEGAHMKDWRLFMSSRSEGVGGPRTKCMDPVSVAG